MISKRYEWLDVSKGIAIILVVMGHVTSIFCSDSTLDLSKPFYALYDFVYLFHMPIFLFISGYLFRTKLDATKNEIKKTAVNRLIAYGIPYIVFSIIYWAVKMLAGAFVNNPVDIKDLVMIPVLPISFLWYLYALLLMTEFSLLLCIKKNNIRLIICIAALFRVLWEILSIIGVLNSWVNNLGIVDFIKNFIWFALGLSCSEAIINGFKEYSKKLSFLVGSIFALICLVFVSWFEVNSIPFLRIVWAIIGIFSIIMISMKINKNRLIEYLGQNTLPVYLIHGIIISFLKIIFDKINFPLLGGVVPLVICTALAILIPLALYCVCKKISILDFAFYPNKYLKV